MHGKKFHRRSADVPEHIGLAGRDEQDVEGVNGGVGGKDLEEATVNEDYNNVALVIVVGVVSLAASEGMLHFRAMEEQQQEDGEFFCFYELVELKPGSSVRFSEKLLHALVPSSLKITRRLWSAERAVFITNNR